MSDMRLEALESRLAELEGREMANRFLLTVLAKTLAQKGISAPQDIARTIDGWEAFYEPARTSTLPDDHSAHDALRRKCFHSALEHFFKEVREALPRSAPSA